jgi:GTPase SAR1 family protein
VVLLQSEYEALRCYAYGVSEVLVMCFSVCERQSFYSLLHTWLPEVRRHLAKRRTPILLVGTQADQRHQGHVMATRRSQPIEVEVEEGEGGEVTPEEGRKMAELVGADCYVECSALSHHSLQQVLKHVVLSAIRHRYTTKQTTTTTTNTTNTTTRPRKSTSKLSSAPNTENVVGDSTWSRAAQGGDKKWWAGRLLSRLVPDRASFRMARGTSSRSSGMYRSLPSLLVKPTLVTTS